eukprot:TRINITY_DN72029_c0_g1_i1.p1 TRINITY_DN72029_c0_g1~~TRINITY_DN72029_c0_g1_i1.p1  ORF type:complete len:464 (-),score=36.42 TRINITY_DN72029_c0_g1_i1:595-1986(-)
MADPDVVGKSSGFGGLSSRRPEKMRAKAFVANPVAQDGRYMERSTQSVNSPAWTHSPRINASKTEKVAMDGAPSPLWKRKPIVTEYNKIQVPNIVSVGSPEFMKSPFETNRKYFDEMGVSQKKLTVVGPENKHRSAGVYYHPAKHDQRGKRGIIVQDTGRTYAKTLTSVDAPAEMRGPFDNHRAHFADKPHLLGETTAPTNAAGLDCYYRGADSKKIHIRLTEDDRLISTWGFATDRCPTFMESPMMNNQEHYSKQGLINDLEHARRKEVAGVATHRIPLSARPVYVANAETGKVYHKNFPSKAAPEWMKSQFSENDVLFQSYMAERLPGNCRADAMDYMGLSRRVPRCSSHPPEGQWYRADSSRRCNSPSASHGPILPQEAHLEDRARQSGKVIAGKIKNCHMHGDVHLMQRSMTPQIFKRSHRDLPRESVTPRAHSARKCRSSTPRRVASPRRPVSSRRRE